LFAQQRWIAEAAQGGIASLFRAHACGYIFCDLALDMKAQLVVETRTGPGALKEHQYSHSHLCKPAHEVLLRLRSESD
jgi:hypothetical protein